MTYEEARQAIGNGLRVTADHFQPGCYLEFGPTRTMKAWPVDRPEDEWQRTQCYFVAREIDEQAQWSLVETTPRDSQGRPLTRPVMIPESEQRDVRPQRSRWGKTSEAAALIAIEQERARQEDEE